MLVLNYQNSLWSRSPQLNSGCTNSWWWVDFYIGKSWGGRYGNECSVHHNFPGRGIVIRSAPAWWSWTRFRMFVSWSVRVANPNQRRNERNLQLASRFRCGLLSFILPWQLPRTIHLFFHWTCIIPSYFVRVKMRYGKGRADKRSCVCGCLKRRRRSKRGDKVSYFKRMDKVFLSAFKAFVNLCIW